MNLLALLRAGAAAHPDQPLVVSPTGAVGWAEATARAESLAAGLLERGTTRFACRVGTTADLVALLAAASATGVEACIYPARLSPAEVDELAEAFGHDVLVTDEAGLTSAVATVLPVEALALDRPASLPTRPDDEVAPVLILTTGTTGRPKGARHDWHRLVAAVRAGRSGPGDRWLLAYNVNQFAGIQVLLHVLALGATAVVPASNQPRDVLVALTDHGVTHASGTPTFWRFLCTQLEAGTTDRIALRQITLGGEATDGALLDELRRRFPAAKVSHVYASTEFGSGVSVRDGQLGLPLSVLERADDADVQFKVVDGELHVRSRVGMLGYHGDDAPADGWRATGDLVEEQGGRLVFVGRTSEVINVGGVKVHPLPLESAISDVPGVALVRVHGRPNPMTGQIVVVDVVAQPDADQREVEAAIRAACASLPRAAQPRRIRFVDELAVRENKVVRT